MEFARGLSASVATLHHRKAPGEKQHKEANFSVGSMFALIDPAKNLMQIEITGTSETYGPCFRIVEP